MLEFTFFERIENPWELEICSYSYQHYWYADFQWQDIFLQINLAE